MPSWIGPWEIAIVLVLILLIFGPRKLPDLGASLGKSIRGFKRGLKETEDEVKTAVSEVRETKEEREAGSLKVESTAAKLTTAEVAATRPSAAEPTAVEPVSVESSSAQAAGAEPAHAEPTAVEPPVAEQAASTSDVANKSV